MNLPVRRLVIAATIAGFLIWIHIQVYKVGANSVRLATAQQALKQIERAQDETRNMQERVNAVQEKYQQARSEINVRDRRIRSLVDRMREQTPSAEQLAQHSAATISRYAYEIQRDFGECRAEYAELGREAARASEAAWACRESWPVKADEKNVFGLSGLAE